MVEQEVGEIQSHWLFGLFMARRAIPIIAFHGRVCVVYVVKEVASFQGARSINERGA